MTTTVLRNLSYVATFDQRSREIVDADIVVSDGLTNAHQYLYQIGMRALPELERASIEPWLSGLGSRCLCWWRNGVLTPETVGALAAAGMESLLTGATTVADCHDPSPLAQIRIDLAPCGVHAEAAPRRQPLSRHPRLACTHGRSASPRDRRVRPGGCRDSESHRARSAHGMGAGSAARVPGRGAHRSAALAHGPRTAAQGHSRPGVDRGAARPRAATEAS